MNASPSSRQAFNMAAAVLAGSVSAACFGFALLNAGGALFFLAYLSPIPLFMAGLGGGSFAGFLSAITGAAELFLIVPSQAVVYLVISAIPAVILVLLALRHRAGADGKTYWYPEGHLLTAAALYPCVLFIAAIFMASDHPGGLLGVTVEAFNEIADQLSKSFSPQEAVAIHTIMRQSAKVAPAFLGCAWIFLIVVSLVVGQILVESRKWNLRSGFSLNELHIPTWLIYAVAATGLVGAMAPAPIAYIGINLAMTLGVPFFFTGVAVIHAWANARRSPVLILSLYYALMFFIPALALLTALFGAVDQWVDFRRHFARRVNKSV